ncbi:MAG TPA: hypothetical protein VFB14_10380 [Bryobacteraceae bacterium]|jgi:hypothetical protein|nr:hypothetical protein [Bryobacteraceae bacterium]
MKRITSLTLFAASGLAGLAAIGALESRALAEAVDEHALQIDVACDCRTGSNPRGTDRGDVFIIQGKMFPAGTLPSGAATNDPTEPVNGVAPIGDWICRGQYADPASSAPAYASTPMEFFTQYFLLAHGTITTEGYETASHSLSSVTGGIDRYRGVSGDYSTERLGTNISGCPNFRVKFRLRRQTDDR